VASGALAHAAIARSLKALIQKSVALVTLLLFVHQAYL
jgi:hypothetical protein